MVFLPEKYWSYFAIIPGWFLGGFIGAAASFLLTREIVNDPSKSKISLELALLKLSSYLIKADGKITQDELNRVRDYFKSKYGIRKSEKLFRQHKEDKKVYSIEELVKILKDKMTPNQYYGVIQFLFSVAASDGHITKGEIDFIYKIGVDFSFTIERLDSLKNQFASGSKKTNTSTKKFSQREIDAFATLGLEPSLSFPEIKAAYRKLAKEFHPDVLNNAHESIKKIAEAKFREIHEAYEVLKKCYE